MFQTGNASNPKRSERVLDNAGEPPPDQFVLTTMKDEIMELNATSAELQEARAWLQNPTTEFANLPHHVRFAVERLQHRERNAAFRNRMKVAA